MVSPAIRSTAASKPQEVCCLPCSPSGLSRSPRVCSQSSPMIARSKILRAGLWRNPRRNIVPGIPNVLLCISCLRLTSTATSAPTKNASSRDQDLYGRWSFAQLRSFFPAGGSREVSRAFAARYAGRSICWHFPAAQGISAPAVRPNAPFSLPKSLRARFSRQLRTGTGHFRSRVFCAVCSSVSAACWVCCPKPPMPRY